MQRNRAFTLIELATVVTLIGLLTSVIIPQFMKSRDNSSNTACAENRRVLDLAKEMWALDYGKSSHGEVNWVDLTPEFVTSSPVCPKGGTYELSGVDEPTTCSIHGRFNLP